MAGTTIATKTKIAVRLTAASQLPLTVTATGAINVASGNAVYVAAALPGVITNLGVIKALGGIGVQALGAASVVNGSTAGTKALIEGSSAGIDISGAATLTNYGTVAATATASTPGFASVGAYLGDGGSVANGSAADKKASIIGGSVGIAAVGAAATLTNFGSVKATGTAGVGVWLADGGKVVNGSAADKTATISGAYRGIYAVSAASVTNFGTVSATQNEAVLLRAGGTLVNGSSTDIAASVSSASHNAFYADGLAAVTNYGTISNTATNHSAVDLYAGGSVVNGSTADTAALIASAQRDGVFAEIGAIGVTNYGTISAPQDDGVFLLAGGTVVNGSSADAKATIIGRNQAVYAAAAATVTNYGTVTSSVYVGVSLYKDGGAVTNFASGRISGVTAGVYGKGAATTVTNLGTITGIKYQGVYLGAGGTVTNGSTANTAATINGGDQGVFAGAPDAVSVTNFGIITGTHSTAVQLSDGGTVSNEATGRIVGLLGIFGTGATTAVINLGTITGGVYLDAGGTVSNEATGRIVGSVSGLGATTAVTNLGTITGSVYLGAGGTVTNGSAADTAATIGGFAAAFASNPAPATITNFGTLSSTSGPTVHLDSGTLVNEATGQIVGLYGIAGYFAAPTITNLGTITGTFSNTGTETPITAAGVRLNDGGTLINSGMIHATDTAASGGSGLATIVLSQGGSVLNEATGRIVGPNGIFGFGATTTIANLGSITGTGFGVWLDNGGTLDGTITNGSATDAIATIKGGDGYNAIYVNTGQVATITNFGTIANSAGTAGTAIMLGGGRLVDEPRSVIVGKVYADSVGGEVLELAKGTSAGNVAGIGTTYFFGFQTVQVDAGASWTVTGANDVASLADNGALTVAGSLDVYTSLDPASTGTIDLGATATLEVASVLGKGPAIEFLTSDKLIVDTAADFGLHVGKTTYIGPLLEHFVAGDAIDLTNVADSGLVLNYATAAGLLTISNGGGALASLLFQNSSLGAGTWHTGTDGGTGTLLTHS